MQKNPILHGEVRLRPDRKFHLALLGMMTAAIFFFTGAQPMHAQSVGQCMVDRYNATKPADVSSLGCRSNDVRLATVTLLSGPTSCIVGEDITITIRGEYLAGAGERYDVGLFVATDGGNVNATGGSCYNDFLHPVSTTNNDLNLTGGAGPFYNAEINDDNADMCGDIEQNESTFLNTSTFTVKCQDSDNDGVADVSTAVVWANSKSAGTANKPSCSNELDVTAETTAKCTVSQLNISGLSVPKTGTIEVIKNLVPTDAAGKFNLQIDSTTEFTDAVHLSSTGAVTVSAGLSTDPAPIGDTHTVGEVEGTGSNLSDYNTVILCADQEGDTVASNDTGPLDVFVEPNDAWVCIITNTRKMGKLTLAKTVQNNHGGTLSLDFVQIRRRGYSKGEE